MKVTINRVEDVKNVCEVCNKYADDVYALSANGYRVDAKSLLGLFSLDLSQEIDLVIDTYKNSIERDFERQVKSAINW